MQTRNLVTVSALSIAFCSVMTAGCSTQGTMSSATRDKTVPLQIDLVRDVSNEGVTLASVGIYVKCIPPSTSPSACMPAADSVTVVTNPSQNIEFNLLTENRVFDERGIEFAQGYFNCTRSGDTRFTCVPNNPPVWTFLKDTIRVYGATPSDPYAFVKN
jgi:hypothetical protein